MVHLIVAARLANWSICRICWCMIRLRAPRALATHVGPRTANQISQTPTPIRRGAWRWCITALSKISKNCAASWRMPDTGSTPIPIRKPS
ncbi:UNVERIFIED_CONTAM: hypothetical protein GTU68_049428 [Idotea baltica]|nr:hypothetical protein [Idotea baltica]